MRFPRVVPALLVALFLSSITVGLSLGVEEKGDFVLRDYKSGFNKSFREVLTGEANILVLTETTCYSCIKELKALETLRARNKGRVTVTAIFLDREGWPRVKKYLDFYQFDLDFALVDSGQTVPERFETNYVPTLLIFDRQAAEKYRKRGFTDGEEEVLAAAIDDVLYPDRTRSAASATLAAPETAPAAVEGNAPVIKSSGCASGTAPAS
jgi:hypothetical protein